MTGTVRTEVDGRICRIVVDNVAKKNAFTPDMMAELSNAFTAFDADDALWVAVLAFAGDHTTAGLDMPKFFGPAAERRDSPAANVDPFALKRRTLKPVVAEGRATDLALARSFLIVSTERPSSLATITLKFRWPCAFHRSHRRAIRKPAAHQIPAYRHQPPDGQRSQRLPLQFQPPSSQ
jgi:enoyl-CoA hydratase/carnithine racemase